MNNKFKRLANNSVLFALGNLGSKLVAFFMLPLYTSRLTSADFGTADLITTTVSLLLPVVTLSIFESVLRFSLESDSDKRAIFTNSLFVSLIGTFLLLLSLIILYAIEQRNIIYMIWILIFQLFQALFSQYAKAIDQVKIFAFNGILLTFLTAISNLILLVYFNLGLQGYLLSICFANLISNVFLWIILKLNKEIVISKLDKSFIFEMFRYSIPLIPNSVALWINNVANRYFILFYLGAAANGIFAVANKIPTLLGVLNTIFFQAWQLSAIEEFDSENKDEFYSKIFFFYSQFMFLGTMFILLMLKPLMSFLVAPEFSLAWKYVPFLLMGVLYSSFSGFFGQYYIAGKNTAGVFYTTIIGAIINVIINAVLIPILGLYGAGISTALSFLCIWLIRVKGTKKIVETKIYWGNIFINHVLLGIQIILLMFVEIDILYILLTINFGIGLIVNRDVLVTVFTILNKLVRRSN